MPYTAIPNSDIDPDSPVTTGLVTLLRDNPIGIAAGDAGAPLIQHAALDVDIIENDNMANDAIQQPEIDNTNSTDSGTLNASGANVNLNDYSFFPSIYCEGSGSNWIMRGHTGSSAFDSPQFRLEQTGGSNLDYQVNTRNITA